MTHSKRQSHSTSERTQRTHQKSLGLNDTVEAIMKDFLARFAEASYNIALKLGFRGSFIAFLSDLQEALEEVIKKDKTIAKSHNIKVSVH